MKTLLSVLLALSLVLSGVLFLQLLEAGIVVDNATTTSEQLFERRRVALEILSRDWVGRSAEDLDRLAHELAEKGIPVSNEGTTREIGDFLFEVEGGVVVEVRDLDGGVELVRPPQSEGPR